jgi:hypothetical protein
MAKSLLAKLQASKHCPQVVITKSQIAAAQVLYYEAEYLQALGILTQVLPAIYDTQIELSCRFLMMQCVRQLQLLPLQVIDMCKKCLVLGLELTDLKVIREAAFSMSVVCNTVNDKVRLHKRDIAA